MKERQVIILEDDNTPNIAIAKTFHGVHPDAQSEDKFFRYFRHPHIQGDSICDSCNQFMHHHAFVDIPGGGLCVCPGETVYLRVDGERVYSHNAISPAFHVLEFYPDGCKKEESDERLLKLRDRLVGDFHRARANMKAVDRIVADCVGDSNFNETAFAEKLAGKVSEKLVMKELAVKQEPKRFRQ